VLKITSAGRPQVALSPQGLPGARQPLAKVWLPAGLPFSGPSLKKQAAARMLIRPEARPIAIILNQKLTVKQFLLFLSQKEIALANDQTT